MSRKISQREARRLRKRVRELERAEERRRWDWAKEWPEGVNLGKVVPGDPATTSAISTARKLKHAVVALTDGGTVYFVALPLGNEGAA